MQLKQKEIKINDIFFDELSNYWEVLYQLYRIEGNVIYLRLLSLHLCVLMIWQINFVFVFLFIIRRKNERNKILEIYSNELISDIAEKLEKRFGQNIWHRFIGLPGSFG